ncbi:hypothetical protein Fmac_019272 [Flemingia macrophylla]|uniref:Uncharacterized protein n=1 Tax=Flemingia macrophylla TaxID=520843 RepID=A0ABD1M7D3_9FABA
MVILDDKTYESFFALLDPEFAHNLGVSLQLVVGSVTPIPQDGNPKPRIFKVAKRMNVVDAIKWNFEKFDYVTINVDLRLINLLCSAVINRCGFNSEGIVVVAKRWVLDGKRKLDETSSSTASSNSEIKHGGKAGPGILGVNLGKNKISEDALQQTMFKEFIHCPNMLITWSVSTEGFKFNNETHLLPILATTLKLLASKLGCEPDDICDFELQACDTQPSTIGGAAKEFIFSGHLDNLCMSFCSLKV